MYNERIVLKATEPPKYIRFGTCLNCNSKIGLIGERWDIEDYLKIACPNCGKGKAVPLGFLHKADSWYAKRKLRKAEINNANKRNQE